MFTGGPAYYFATLNKQNTLVQEKPLDPTWNKEIFSEIFFYNILVNTLKVYEMQNGFMALFQNVLHWL